MYPDAIYVERPELLNLPYFWRFVLARQLSSLVGDPFDDATSYFGFRCTDRAPKQFTSNVERKLNVPDDKFASHFVYVTTKSKWRVGRTFHNCPEDNTVSFDLVAPDGIRTTIGSDWGSFFIPALRWSEIMRIVSAIRLRRDKACVIMMLLPGVGGDLGRELEDIRPQVFGAIKTLDFATKRLDELAELLIHRCYMSADWFYDRSVGWINNGRYSFRAIETPLANSPSELRIIKRFFRSLA